MGVLVVSTVSSWPELNFTSWHWRSADNKISVSTKILLFSPPFIFSILSFPLSPLFLSFSPLISVSTATLWFFFTLPCWTTILFPSFFLLFFLKSVFRFLSSRFLSKPSFIRVSTFSKVSSPSRTSQDSISFFNLLSFRSPSPSKFHVFIPAISLPFSNALHPVSSPSPRTCVSRERISSNTSKSSSLPFCPSCDSNCSLESSITNSAISLRPSGNLNSNSPLKVTLLSLRVVSLLVQSLNSESLYSRPQTSGFFFFKTERLLQLFNISSVTSKTEPISTSNNFSPSDVSDFSKLSDTRLEPPTSQFPFLFSETVFVSSGTMSSGYWASILFDVVLFWQFCLRNSWVPLVLTNFLLLPDCSSAFPAAWGSYTKLISHQNKLPKNSLIHSSWLMFWIIVILFVLLKKILGFTDSKLVYMYHGFIEALSGLAEIHEYCFSVNSYHAGFADMIIHSFCCFLHWLSHSQCKRSWNLALLHHSFNSCTMPFVFQEYWL